jgi:hypothetical protein
MVDTLVANDPGPATEDAMFGLFAEYVVHNHSAELQSYRLVKQTKPCYLHLETSGWGALSTHAKSFKVPWGRCGCKLCLDVLLLSTAFNSVPFAYVIEQARLQRQVRNVSDHIHCSSFHR